MTHKEELDQAHRDSVTVSKWAIGIILALTVHLLTALWWARGLQADLEVVKVQGQYTLEKIGDNNRMLDHRIGALESEFKEMKTKLGKF